MNRMYNFINYIYWKKEAKKIHLTQDEMKDKLREVSETRKKLSGKVKTRRDLFTNDTYKIDSKGNYAPENCRWVTREDNGRNIAIASMSYIVVNNISKTGRDWSKYLNLGANTINTYRKVYGIDIVKKFIKARMEDMSKEKNVQYRVVVDNL